MRTIFWNIMMMLALLCSAQTAHAEKEWFEGGIWEGEFKQTSPALWSGKMIVKLFYDLDSDEPYTTKGIIIWPALGGAVTKIVGQRAGSKIRFVEKECVKTRCSVVQLGGEYDGKEMSREERAAKAKES